MESDLQDYWGVGPKTAALLTDALGEADAIRAIESADVTALVDAGVPAGRATRVLRRASDAGDADVFATDDARDVYDRVLDVATSHALTERARDRIRVLAPLDTHAAAERRLDEVEAAVTTWTELSDAERDAAVAAFEEHESREAGDLAAVETALALIETGLDTGTFAAFADLDADALRDAAAALRYREGDDGVAEGYDDRLDALREQAVAVERLATDAVAVLDDVRAGDLRGPDAFREAVVEHVTEATGVEAAAVREHAATEATDAADFVSTTLRSLADARREAAAEREATVRADLDAAVEAAEDDVERAADAVPDAAFACSLARFAIASDLTRPEYTDDAALAVVGARNLGLLADGVAVQSVTYALGDHEFAGPPAGDRVSVLTGANSGGKTTLLETLAEVATLASLGLPVPAERALVGDFDRLVFHRRHASFNAGVLETTLRSVVPPLASDGRTLMLVDEFEAITEPGSAADLLHGLVSLTADSDALGVYVTHLADDLDPLPGVARVDGIFAEGLSDELALEVDYQPRFGVVGRSTPEFIVERLVANADGAERAAFATLRDDVGGETPAEDDD
ncbi:DNA mismatch repair protein [Halarchaeum acidiphilum MH1-52-1]|uniref:DNA mismatch repair protein n=1 Tax=Halarchaeum acidiphilum MH1-52-1 TaxID=1261545 RepID=U3AAW8_9EURY|nr:DNA mismatch repair protein [Halarchaeum acidiphilum]GAD51903.1 DNA mismatch repair protein [Halarchaeum acidiphilum MH1-52-1]